MPPEPFIIRQRRRVDGRAGPTPAIETPYVPDTAPVVESPRSGVMSRVWLEWARRVTDLAADSAAAVNPHAPTHEPGGSDPLTVDAAPGVGSLRTLGAGPNQAAPGNDPRFAAGADLDYLGAYAPGTYNDGDIVVGSDGIAYLCVKDGTTTPPEAWPGAQTPVLHHLTHEPGGSDPMAVDASPSVGSLRTLGAGANQAAAGNDARFAAGTAAHHASHEPGGADALANVAWVNLANVFAAAQTIAHATTPELRFNESAQGTNLKLFRIVGNSQLLLVQTLNDAGAALANVLVLDRGGNANVGNNLTVNGAGGNVACKDQANTFTNQQTLTYASPRWNLIDTAQPAEARVFQFVNNGQILALQALNDAQSIAQSVPLLVTRTGDVRIERDLFEKGRAFQVGHWQATPFAAGNFVGAAPMAWTVAAGNILANRYALVGKTLFWVLQIQNSTLSGTATNNVLAVIPGGFLAAAAGGMTTKYNNAGAWLHGDIQWAAGSNTIQFVRIDFGNFALGPLYTYAFVTLEIQ